MSTSVDAVWSQLQQQRPSMKTSDLRDVPGIKRTIRNLDVPGDRSHTGAGGPATGAEIQDATTMQETSVAEHKETAAPFAVQHGCLCNWCHYVTLSRQQNASVLL